MFSYVIYVVNNTIYGTHGCITVSFNAWYFFLKKLPKKWSRAKASANSSAHPESFRDGLNAPE